MTFTVPLDLPPHFPLAIAAQAARRLGGRLICRRSPLTRRFQLFVEMKEG